MVTDCMIETNKSKTNLDGISLAEHPGLGDGNLRHEVPYVRVVECHLLASIYLKLSEHGA